MTKSKKVLTDTGLNKLVTNIHNTFAPLNSPELIGAPTAPTPTAGDNSTKVATTAFVQNEMADYLPLSGGTLKGNIYTTPSHSASDGSSLPEYGQTMVVSKGFVEKGTMPDYTEYHTMVMATDSTGSVTNAHKYGQVETSVNPNGSTETEIKVYKNEADDTTAARIAVGINANGDVYTAAPTPVAGDNSTKIATTAFVNTKVNNLADFTQAQISNLWDGLDPADNTEYMATDGGIMEGAISWENTDGNHFQMRFNSNTNQSPVNDYTPSFNNFDFGWKWGEYSGAGFALRGANYPGADSGAFIFWARTGDKTTQLIGHPSGALTWGNQNILTEQANAGFHNSIFRGKALGNALTADQSATIQAGTFNDLYIGDYWTIPVSFTYYRATTDATAQSGKQYYSDAAGTKVTVTAGTDISSAGYFEAIHASGTWNWRIAGFDYWYNVGDTNFNKHHVVIVPDTILYSAQMHITNTNGYIAGSAANKTEGGYIATDLYKGLVAAQAAAETAFGVAHIPSRRVLLPTSCTGGKYTNWAWTDRKIDIMTEVMVYGARAWGAAANNGYSVASQNSQLPLFHLSPQHRHTRQGYWLQDVSSAASFCYVTYSGHATFTNASYSGGVRPAFALI